MRTGALIDRFVAHVNGSGVAGWSIRRSDTIAWLPSFERRLPRGLPPRSGRDALQHSRIRTLEEVAPSLRRFVECILGGTS